MAKRRYYKQNVQATDRDRALIRYLGEHGCASAEQLATLFWEGRKPRTAKDRLAQLVKAGYIHATTAYARGHEEEVYWIERKGSMLFDREIRQDFQTGKPAQAEVAHILKTNDVVHRMGRKYTVVNVKHEHHLKSVKARTRSHAQVADAQVTIERDGTRHSFMLEIDGKYHGRMLQAKVHDYGASGRPVLWVVYSEPRLVHLKDLCGGFLNIRPVLFDQL